MNQTNHTEEMEIVRLFLEKVELLNPREREVLIYTIDLLNHPLYVTNDTSLGNY